MGVKTGDRVSIIHHPDVRRMLMSMKAQTEAMRAIATLASAHLDVALLHPDKAQRAANQAMFDLLTPVVKGWCTEQSIEVASLGIQVHGGMGFVEETGAAQYFRDARITTIYEGTTGIQANDLVGRKVAYEKGATIKVVIDRMRKDLAELRKVPHPALDVIAKSLEEGINALAESTDWLLASWGTNMKAAGAGSVPFLKLFGTVAGGWQMARAALIAKRQLDAKAPDSDFYRAKLATARFYAEHVLPLAKAYAHEITHGAESVLALDEAQF
jgi:acyl-CoA dehydrogenase